MNYRQKGINIRVNTNEKKILKAKAKKCKLSVKVNIKLIKKYNIKLIEKFNMLFREILIFL